MTRVINTASPGKIRSQSRRTIAELLRHLMTKRGLDEESLDMAAAIVFALRAIADSIETTTAAWEKRNYFVKADRFRLEWEWAGQAAKRLEAVIRQDAWDQMPAELARLLPRFADVKIVKMTRKPETWQSSYALLMREE